MCSQNVISLAKARKRKQTTDLLDSITFPGFAKLSPTTIKTMELLLNARKPTVTESLAYFMGTYEETPKSQKERIQKTWEAFRELMLIFREKGMVFQIAREDK